MKPFYFSILAVSIFFITFPAQDLLAIDDGNANKKGVNTALASQTIGTVTTEEYSPQVLITAKWGTAPGEFGHLIIQAPGDTPKKQGLAQIVVGPDCIFVDKGDNTYILDQINSRVEKFSSTGIFVEAIPIAFPKDVIVNDIHMFSEMYVDESGVIYISYNVGPFSWFVFDKNGKFVKRLVDKKSIEDQIDGLANRPLQTRRKEVLEAIVSDAKTLLVDVPIATARYGNNSEIYIGNIRLKMGISKKMTSVEMNRENVLTASQKGEEFVSRAKKKIYESKREPIVRLSNITTGDQCVSSGGDVYKITKSTGSTSAVQVIKWQKKK